MKVMSRFLRSIFHIGNQTGLTSSIGLAALCGVYALAYNITPTFLNTLSATCLFWTLYLADRLKDPNPGEGQPSQFAQQHKRLCWYLFAIAVSGLLITCWLNPNWLLPMAGLLVCGAAYFTKIPGVGRPIKDLPGIKSFYAASVILAICHLYVWPAQPQHPGQWVAIASILMVEQVSNALYDMKDQEVDQQLGIRTLILMLGKKHFLLLEGCIALLAGVSVLIWPTAATPALAFAMFLHVAAVIILFKRDFDSVISIALDGLYSTAMLIAIIMTPLVTQ